MDALAQRYELARTAHREINEAILPRMSRTAVRAVALSLGMSGAPVDEDDAALLTDCAFYDHLVGGRNLVERFAARSPYRAGTLHARVLDAMTRAEMTVLDILEIVPGVGAHVFDVLFQRERLLADRLLGEHGYPGMRMAARLLDLGEFVMTTGAPIEFPEEIAEFLLAIHEDAPREPEASAADRARNSSEVLYFATVPREEVGSVVDRLRAARAQVLAARSRRDVRRSV